MVGGLIVLAIGTYACKSIGPMFAVGRELPPVIQRLADLLPAALLAALVATQALALDGSLRVDARIVGVAAAGLSIWLRAPFAIVVLVGAGTTALTRFLGWG